MCLAKRGCESDTTGESELAWSEYALLSQRKETGRRHFDTLDVAE